MTTSNSQKSAKSKWELTKEIINDMYVRNNRVFTVNEVYEEFKRRYPDKVNSNLAKAKKTTSDDLKMMSVNPSKSGLSSRLSHLYIYGKPSPGKKLRNPKIKGSNSEYPRISNPKNERDFLYDLGDGEYEIYEPSKHGVWEIVLDEDDVNHLRKIENKTIKNQLNSDSQANLLLDSLSKNIELSNNHISTETNEEQSKDILDITNQIIIENTTREQLILARLGQGRFRQNVIDSWGIGERCAVTNIDIKALLIASHIIPWCESDDNQRLSGTNGILFCSHLDKLFDRHLISFDEYGKLIFSNRLTEIDRKQLEGISIFENMRLNVTMLKDKDILNVFNNIAAHRQRVIM